MACPLGRIKASIGSGSKRFLAVPDRVGSGPHSRATFSRAHELPHSDRCRLLPPTSFVAGTMNRGIVDWTERHRAFGLPASERTRLHVAKKAIWPP